MEYFYVILLLCQINVLCASDVESRSEHVEIQQTADEEYSKLPTVLIVTLFRNKAHTMPYFLTFLDRLYYPKDRISLWIRTDHNEDQTLDVLYQWLSKSVTSFHNINIEYDNATARRDSETSRTHWSTDRYLQVIKMKEEALNYGRDIWADYIFFLDADVLLTYSMTLFELVKLEAPIVAPMLLSDGLYSNFWCGMTPDYYYQRTDEYKSIYNYQKRGLFDVPMVHSAVLINLNDKRSDKLTFDKTILGERFSLAKSDLELVPTDDIIIFAVSANYSEMPSKISNEQLYGFVTVPLDAEENFEKDHVQLTNLKIMILNESGPSALDVEPELEHFVNYPPADTLSLDRIFMINLHRRPERRAKMERSFKELGLVVESIPAVDGSELSQEYLDEIGIRYLPGYADPFQQRPMTKGEIGCFLSHFWIWEKQVSMKLNEVLVLEDDIRFEPFFKQRALELIEEARQIGGWDLIYFGRKRMVQKNEKWVSGSDRLVHASYSYWTLGYVLSLKGARKLLDARPLENLIPVDEFLPIMFDQHMNDTWKQAFPNRDLVAWSAAPLLLYPTHYTGDDGYFSDTEQSDTITEDDAVAKKGNKESYNGSSTESADDNSSTDSKTIENKTIDTSFIIDNLNKHATVVNHQPSQQHTEL